MNSNLSLDTYVCTYIARALSSLTIVIISSFGIAVVDKNMTGNNFHYKHQNVIFHNWFFGITILIESISCVMFIALYILQRGKYDISNINRIDCKGSCVFIFFRLFWTLSLSIFILASINQLNSGSDEDPFLIYKKSSDPKRTRELEVV